MRLEISLDEAESAASGRSSTATIGRHAEIGYGLYGLLDNAYTDVAGLRDVNEHAVARLKRIQSPRVPNAPTPRDESEPDGILPSSPVMALAVTLADAT
jgi:hypothetical protein